MTVAFAHWMERWRGRAPGIVLVSVLALAGAMAAQMLSAPLSDSPKPVLSPVLFAIALGICWRHWHGVADESRPGVEWIAHQLLRTGIALVGLQLTLRGVESVIGLALPVIVACISVALLVSAVIGKWLSIRAPLRALLAVGSAVCGCTAIAATASVVRARAEETGAALCCVVLIGGAGMLFYPWLAQELFANDPRAAAVFLGTSIHDTSQVIGAALLYEQHFDVPGAAAMAGATKLFRNLSLLILVPLLATLMNARGESVDASKRPRLLDVLPGFILAFIALAALRMAADTWLSAGSVAQQGWNALLAVAGSVSSWLIIAGMCAMGLGVSVDSMRQLGGRIVALAVTVAVAIALTSASTLKLLT
jgi:uncharacterized integral membrane protein (TIGR00698 family)